MILIYSGGMDSQVLLHKYKNKITGCLSFNYGSKHNDREFEMAKLNCRILGIPLKRIDLRVAMRDFKSDLLKTGGKIPDGHYEDKSMKRTVVPFRNAIMLSIAAGYAESVGAKSVAIANHKGDHAIYPDCRESFIHAMVGAMYHGTYAKIKLFSPFVNLSKREIALLGKEIGVNHLASYSCYKGGKIHCGTCGTCTERMEALEGFDHTIYVRPSGKPVTVKAWKQRG